MKNYQKYINVTDAEKQWGFYVNTVGSAKVGPNKNYPNNRIHPENHSFTWDKGRILDGFYIVFITRGEGILESARTKTYTVKAGTCFLLFPGIWHRYRPHPKHGWEEYWVGFNGSYPTELMQNGNFTPESPFIEVGLNTELLDLFHLLIKKVQIAELGYRQIISGLALQILGHLHTIAKYKPDGENGNSKWMMQGKFLLQESIDSPENLEEVLKDLPMSYSSFRKIFKEQMGISPNQYVLELRLDKAMQLLRATNMSINEIADQAGFDSISYFSRMFKQRTSISPKEYRAGFGGLGK
jgi:AraC-like DNA-binding protein